jgi:two-component system, cell cycle sensor histidine kinase and response regulator CckA
MNHSSTTHELGALTCRLALLRTQQDMKQCFIESLRELQGITVEIRPGDAPESTEDAYNISTSAGSYGHVVDCSALHGTDDSIAEFLRESAAVLAALIERAEVLETGYNRPGRPYPHDRDCAFIQTSELLLREATIRHNAQRTVACVEAELAATLRCRGEAIIIVDTEGIVTRFNAEAERLSGIETREAIGRPAKGMISFIDPETRQPVPNPVNRALGPHGSSSRFSHLLLTSQKMEDDRHVAVRCDLISDGMDANRNGAVLIVRDETDRHTREMLGIHAEKLESIGRLASGIAHDFNNLAGGITGCAELLAESLTDRPDLADYAHTILHATTRASGLAGGLLSFARTSPEKDQIIDMHEIIDDVVKLLRHTLDRRIVISHNFRAGRSCVRGDLSRLQNGLLNLAVNAHDAMPDGGELTFATRVAFIGNMDIRARRHNFEPGEYLEISVIDTGTGIDAETLEHMFEPFFTTKALGDGTGLGLYSLRGTIQNHGGSIGVRSELGQGSTFTVLLPLHANTESKVQIELSEPVYGEGRILVVDDEKVIRDVAERLLGKLGYDVLTAEDGADALNIFQRMHEQIDLVLLDVIMPRIDGRECLVRMREIDPGMQAVISSGITGQDVTDGLGECGDTDFLRKPYTGATLSHVVARAIIRKAETAA